MGPPDAAVWGDPVFWRVVLGGTLRLATPIVLAAIGETVVERSGTLNLGVDGMMTAGAFAGIVGASLGGWPLGLALAAAVGLALGLAMAAAILLGGANQIVAGIAMSLIAIGLTTYGFELWQPSGQAMPFVPLVPTLHPSFGDRGLVQSLLSQNLLTYAAVILLGLTWLGLAQSRIGLLVKASGDDPRAALLRGVPVAAVRTAALAFGGAMAGLGGAAITIGVLGSYSEGVTAGRGYIAIAVVIIGRWSPQGAVLGALLFAFFDSLSLRIQGHAAAWPSEAYTILPYAVTLAVLVLTARSRTAPRTLGAALDTELR